MNLSSMRLALVLSLSMATGLSVSYAVDCNHNGVDDADDITNATSLDCQPNGIPDECDLAETLSYSSATNFGPGFTATARPDIIIPAELNLDDGGSDLGTDWLVGDFDSNEILVMINDGTGMPSGSDSITLTAGTSIHDLLAADLDNDGDQDVVVISRDTSLLGTDLTVFLRNGTGDALPLAFTGTSTDLHDGSNCHGTQGCRATGVTAGLFNNDAFLDLAVTTTRGPGGGGAADNVMVLLNDGSGGFSSINQVITAGNIPLRIGCADVVGSSDIDLVVPVRGVGGGTDTIEIYPGDGTGMFDDSVSPVTITTGVSDPTSIEIVDIDGVDGPDLIVALQDIGNSPGSVGVYLNDGAGGFTEVLVEVGDEPVDAQVADFDGDSDLDIVTANSIGDSLTVVLNDGTHSFADMDPLTLSATDDPRSVAILDLDGDGVLDLASANQGDDMVSFFFGTLTAAASADTSPENGIPDTCDVVGNQPPVASCVATLVRCPDGMNQAALTADDVDDGSMDPNGDDLSLTLSAPSPGPNYSDGETVTLTVAETGTPDLFSDTCMVTLSISASSVSLSCPGSVPDVVADASCMGALPDVTALVTVNDACSGSPTLSQAPPAGTMASLGTHFITVTVDDGGTMANCMVTVDVVDGTGPVITILGDNPAVVACGATYTDAGATGADNCDNSVSVNETANTVDTSAAGMYQVDYDAMDTAGNLATATRTVNVVDSTLPVITCPVDMTLEANTGSCTYSGAIGTATAIDECGDPAITNDAPVEFPLGDTTVTWTATDSGGNIDTCTQTVTVTDQTSDSGLDMDGNGVIDVCEVDNDPPIAVCQDLTVSADGVNCEATVAPEDIDAGSTDPDGDDTSLALSPAGPYGVGTIEVTLTVTDTGGLTDTCTAMLTVEDSSVPVITCPPNVTFGANTESCGYTGAFGTATATSCSSGSLTISDDAPDEFPLGDTTVTWTASDGNTDVTCEQTVTVVDSADFGGGAGTGGGVNFSTETLTVPDQPLTVWCADINNDEHIDLFTGHIVESELRVWFNNGDATFSSGSSIPTGQRPFSVAFGDYDEDGTIDLAIANDLASTKHITIALNKDGTGANFQASDISDITLDEATSDWAPSGIITEDFNLDMHLDIAVCVRRSDRMVYLEGDGDGNFTSRVSINSAGQDPFRMVAVRVNGGDLIDIMTANQVGDNVTPYRNDLLVADMDFARQSRVEDFDFFPHDIDKGDLDGDGLEEIVVPTAETNLFYVSRRADASSRFGPPVPFATGVAPKGLRLGDFNCDGKLDVATADEGDETVSVHINTSTGVGDIDFAAPVAFPVGVLTRFLCVADLDRDGDDDIVSADRGDKDDPGDDQLTILLNSCAAGTDCDENGVLDNCDIASNPELDQNDNGILDSCEGDDCNSNGIPDQNELGGNDCNSNQIPDDCELVNNDCNGDLIPDDCQLAGADCDNNQIPDECQLASEDCNNDGVLDGCQLGGNDCNANNVPDDCELAGNDCDTDGIPDDCQLVGNDCNSNQVLDRCELPGNDCNSNDIPDDCELASNDCNGNSTPDDCELDANDCNLNGTVDSCDIADGTSLDLGGNGVPDECEIDDCNENGVDDPQDISDGTSQDCNNNSIPDECDLSSGIALDCNSNGVPDSCDIAIGTALDCDGNTVPDTCDIASGADDCNSNDIPDSCELAAGTVADCNSNGVPDSCDIAAGAGDCDGNGMIDSCEIDAGAAADCNLNLVPDACDITAGTEEDCDMNGVPDSCEIASGEADCNLNGVPDACDILAGTSNDCNGNSVPDSCEIAEGVANDCNVNGLLDACEIAAGQGEDCNENGSLDQCDIASGQSMDVNLDGVPDECGGRQVPGDCNQDGEIDIADPICFFGVLFTGIPESLPCGNGGMLSITQPGNITLMDANGLDGLDLSDGIHLLQWLFAGGSPHVLAVPGNAQLGCIKILECPDNEVCPSEAP